MYKVFIKYIIVVMLVLSPGVQADDQSAGLDSVQNLRAQPDNIYSSGQPHPEVFVEFASRGGSDVINLRSLEEMKSIDEETAVTDAGMRYHHIPVASIGDLNQDNAQQLHQLLAQADNQNTLIHCKSSNRVGALMALRAVWFQDKSTEEALAIGKQHGLTTLETKVIEILNQP